MARLSFHRVSNESMPTSGMTMGAVYFNTDKHIIEVATSATTTEQYGLVRNATWANNILTIWKASDTDAAPSIKLDFNDVPSASDVQTILSSLRDSINAIDKSVTTITSQVETNTGNIKKNADAIQELQNVTGTGSNGLGTRVTNLENTVNDKATGLAATKAIADKNKNDISDLQSKKADKATTLAGYGITDAYTKTQIDSKMTSALKYKGSYDTFAKLKDAVTNPENGDVYNIKQAGGTGIFGTAIKAGDNVAYNAEAKGWDVLGGTTDLSAYATTDSVTSLVNGVSTRVKTIEDSYVKTVKGAVTVASGKTQQISVTPTTGSKGEVTLTVNESTLDATLAGLRSDVDQAKTDAKAGVLSFGGKTGTIAIDGGNANTMGVKFAMGGTDGRTLTATVNPYKDIGSLETPVYIAGDGTPTKIFKDTTVTPGSSMLVTSGAVDTRIKTEVSTLNTTISDLSSLNWAEWPK